MNLVTTGTSDGKQFIHICCVWCPAKLTFKVVKPEFGITLIYSYMFELDIEVVTKLPQLSNIFINNFFFFFIINRK